MRYEVDPDTLELNERAELRGLNKEGVWDYAMPQDWFNGCVSLTGFNPSGHIVWYYPHTTALGGEPRAVSKKGDDILLILAGIKEEKPAIYESFM